MQTFATRGNARIRWEHCNPRYFLDQPLFLEAANSGQVNTIEDLAMFLSETDVLACPDSVCIQALLEINRHLYDIEGRPRIFYSETLYYTSEQGEEDDYVAYSVLEFSPREDDIFLGFLRPDVLDSEQVIPDRDVWVCTSIKSML